MQETYLDSPEIGRPGQVARPFSGAIDLTKKSDAVMPFGRATAYDAADDRVKLPAAATDITTREKFQGVSTSNPPREITDAAYPYHPADSAFVSRLRGPIFVEVEQAVDVTDPVYVRFLANPGINESGTISFAPVPAKGTFKLSFGGVKTAALNWNDTAEEIQAALEAISTVGEGNILIGGSIAAGLTFAFQGDLAKTNVGAITVTDNALLDDTGTSEVQSVTPSVVPAKGAFKLTFGGQETTSLAWNADAATITAALEALSTIGAGNVVVTGTLATSLQVAFGGTLAHLNVGVVSCATNTLYDDSGVNEVQTITSSEAPAKGAYKLTFGAEESGSLAWNADAAAVTAALEALTGIGAGNVVVTGSFATHFTATFGGSLAKTNVGALSCVTNTLAKADDTPVTLAFATSTPGTADTAATLTVATITPGVADAASEETVEVVVIGEVAQANIGGFRKDADDANGTDRAALMSYANYKTKAAQDGIVLLEVL